MPNRQFISIKGIMHHKDTYANNMLPAMTVAWGGDLPTSGDLQSGCLSA